ncbi:MAG: serine hydrolase domain-containing protein [Bacteroidales bacterium]|jgi:D-alanyl-D-alanine carboxypeptidase
MKKSAFVVILFLIVFTSCKRNSTDSLYNLNYQSDLQTLIDDHWHRFSVGKENFPGGYALQILSPAGDYFVSTGDLSNTTNKTHFRGASTTKTFTAAAIVLLYQQGRLNLSDFVNRNIPGTTKPYLPETGEFDIPFKEKITIKSLLQHRSGVFDVTNANIPDSVDQPYAGKRYVDYIIEDLDEPFHTFTIAEMANVVAVNQLYADEPEEAYHYSNTGYGLLALIIERISGQRYDQFIEEQLLIPNGLNETSFPYLGDDIAMPAPFASSYYYFGGEQENVTEHNVSMHVAEGNIITTPEDLANWIKSLYTGRAGIENKYVQFLMMDCQPTYESHQYYGLGTTFTPFLGYGHNGGHKAFFTSTRYDPDTDITFVIYTNVWDFDLLNIDLYAEILNMYDLVYDAKEMIQK